MPGKRILSSSYQNLLTAVKKALTGGLLAAQKVLEYERLKTYWQIGKEINAAVATSKGELRLGETLYLKIRRDINRELGLDLSVDALGRMTQFQKNYPRFPSGTTLTFSHYMALQRIQNPEFRLKLEKIAIKKDMTVPELKEEVTRVNLESQPVSTGQGKCLVCERGEPFVYYLRPETSLDGREIFRIDCGFKINTCLPADSLHVPEQSRVIRSVKENGKYTIHLYRDGRDKLYTYAAVVTRVVDGDTIDARIDVGFGIGLYDRLRLKGINAPEINTQAGRLARKFLKDQFANCPVIIIRSSKSEMYGRWLADVFCLPGCDDPHKIAAHGEYLNQTLLDQGLAELYR
ncbi:MAG TPA: hypothetical protein DD723_04235 [Candidatus Omnitrophica bacterium]|nr:MAG: hypothetical protein A2Z81_02815 [Omnitrophica WOR_2 bacterium GWA2_45_18]OGX18602.1 MAG: hypothetical protein A2Y04_03755 [Omnitrophica WOR_2 bacterium GWC2_45_7]HBR14740.1 hypothetical protein [Candidatus Omnitrophota bacterium]